MDDKIQIKSEWLGMTEQQLQILLSAYAIELDGEEITPSNILSRFQIKYQHTLRRQNLFTQMKPLLEKNILIRLDRKKYEVNVEAIQTELSKHKNLVSGELITLNKLSKQLDKELEEIISQKTKPKAMYLEEEEFMAQIGNHISHSTDVFIYAAPFPNISYTNKVMASLGRKKFYEAIKEIKKSSKPAIHYISPLIVELPYRRALKVFRNSKKAKSETIKMINNLRYLASEKENVEILYWKYAVGSPLFILKGPRIGGVYLSLKGSEVTAHHLPSNFKNAFPGVCINSKEIAQRAIESYNSFSKESTPLDTPEGEVVLDDVKKQLANI